MTTKLSNSQFNFGLTILALNTRPEVYEQQLSTLLALQGSLAVRSIGMQLHLL